MSLIRASIAPPGGDADWLAQVQGQDVLAPQCAASAFNAKRARRLAACRK